MTESPVKRMRGRPPRGDAMEARQAILDAALHAFARTGFKATSIGEIAAAAEVAKPLIHYHFGSKEELWKACVAHGFDEFRDEAIRFGKEAREADPDDLLLAFSRAIVRATAKRPHIHLVCLDEFRVGGPRADWIIENYIRPLSGLMTAGFQGLGFITDPSQMVHIYPAMHGAMNFAFMDPSTQTTVFGADVFSEEYIEEHAILAAKLLKVALTDS